MTDIGFDPLTTAAIKDILQEKGAEAISENISGLVFSFEGIKYCMDTSKLPYLKTMLIYNAPQGRPLALSKAISTTDSEGCFTRISLDDDDSVIVALYTVESEKHHLSFVLDRYLELLMNTANSFVGHYREEVDWEMRPTVHSIPGTENN